MRRGGARVFAGGGGGKMGKNVSLLLREPLSFALALKKSLSGGGGGGDTYFPPTSKNFHKKL